MTAPITIDSIKRAVGREPRIKTRSEQILEWLFQMSKHRKLTNEEWEQVRRCEHAIYCRARKQEIEKAEEAEAEALERTEAEAGW